MAEIETKPEGSRVRIRDVVKKVEPGVEPTIAAKQGRSTQIQKSETVSGRAYQIVTPYRKNRKKANHSFRWQRRIGKR